jgi:hypothetical protein
MRFMVWAIRHPWRVFIGYMTIWASQGLCLWLGFGQAGYTRPMATALVTIFNQLMAINSPDQLEPLNVFLIISRHVGWAVAVTGWLVLPTLIGATAARAQQLDDELQTIEKIR